MITVSISINGSPIYTRTAVNIGNDNKRYNVDRYKVDDGEIIFHDPKEGAIVLAKKMLDTIKEVK